MWLLNNVAAKWSDLRTKNLATPTVSRMAGEARRLAAITEVIETPELVEAVAMHCGDLESLAELAEVSHTFEMSARQQAVVKRVVGGSTEGIADLKWSLGKFLVLPAAALKRVRPKGLLTPDDFDLLLEQNGGTEAWKGRRMAAAASIKLAEERAAKAELARQEDQARLEAALARPIAPLVREACADGREVGFADGMVIVVTSLASTPQVGELVEVNDQHERQSTPLSREWTQRPWLRVRVVHSEQLRFEAALEPSPELVAEAAAAEAAAAAAQERATRQKQEVEARIAALPVPAGKSEARQHAISTRNEIERVVAASAAEVAVAEQAARQKKALAAPYKPHSYDVRDREGRWRVLSDAVPPGATNGSTHVKGVPVEIVLTYDQGWSYKVGGALKALGPQELSPIAPLQDGSTCLPITCVVRTPIAVDARDKQVNIPALLTGWHGPPGESTWTLQPTAATWHSILEEVHRVIIADFKPHNKASTSHVSLSLGLAKPKSAAATISAYREACSKGGKGKAAHFKLEIAHIWKHWGYYRGGGGGGCIDGGAIVELADGSHMRACELSVGDAVASQEVPSATVVATWRMRVGRPIRMVNIGGVRLTPDHPVLVGDQWQLPTALAASRCQHVDEMFNFVLSRPVSLRLKAAESVVMACTLAQPVPSFPDPIWGTTRIVSALMERPDWPNVSTEC